VHRSFSLVCTIARLSTGSATPPQWRSDQPGKPARFPTQSINCLRPPTTRPGTYSASRRTGRRSCISRRRSTRKLHSHAHFRVICRVVDLVTLLSRIEGKTLEFKRDLSSPQNVLKAIVAFANTSGGIIVPSLISDSIAPALVPSIEVMPWRKTQVLAVEIYPSPNRPHYLNREGPVAGVLVRVGSTNRRADSFLIEEMRRYRQVSSFDEQPMPDLNSEEVDFRAASEYFKPIRKLTPHGLQTLKLTAGYQGRTVPTTGGVLLFGPARLEHFPDAWIQVGRFAGADRRRILDSAEVRSYLPGAPEEVIAFLRKHMTREAVIGPVKRTDLWTFPLVAVREAIMNAIVHADYAQPGAPIRVALFDDRLEVERGHPKRSFQTSQSRHRPCISGTGPD
jgi:ATP-dependent DNA helicase RecG